MDYWNKIALIIVLLCCSRFSFSQTFIPGNTYYDSTGYVEYRAGNLPIIISAPHGGSFEPTSIPDRTCTGCVLVKDGWTQPIAEGIHEALFQHTGCYPHLIINLLHRKKFDANRDIVDAADGNPIVEQSWVGYHEFIDAAKAQVVSDYGRGLFLDIHGHAHTIQRIELGYLLTRSELQLSDAVLNSTSYIEESSVRTLANDNILNHSHAQLLRGQNSYGALLVEKGFPTVPSFSDPFPQGSDPYFSGGYNTLRHGSKDNEGEIDAIQVELNNEIRFTDSIRLILIDSLAHAATEYYGLHYNDQFENNYCNIVNSSNDLSTEKKSIQLFPNPTSDLLTINGELSLPEIQILNSTGQICLVLNPSGTMHTVDISALPTGLYFVRVMEWTNTFFEVQKLIKK